MGCMKMKQKKVWILCGIPGSGKSTWIRKQIAENGGVHCSRDEIRFSLLKDGEDYFAHENEVVKLWFKKVSEAILNPEVENIYIDATHLTEKARKKTIDALPYGTYELITVFFDVPLEVCLERNSQRSGRALVPEETIKNMLQSYSKSTMYGDKSIYVGEEG